MIITKALKVGLSTSKTIGFICLNKSPLKVINFTLYLILKAFSFLRYLYFCPDFLGVFLKVILKFMTSQTVT